jgi:hypothetical protein
MDKSIFAAMPTLTPALGYASMIGLGLFSLALSYGVKTLLVRNTHDFIIADRRVGFGFGRGIGDRRLDLGDGRHDELGDDVQLGASLGCSGSSCPTDLP